MVMFFFLIFEVLRFVKSVLFLRCNFTFGTSNSAESDDDGGFLEVFAFVKYFNYSRQNMKTFMYVGNG